MTAIPITDFTMHDGSRHFLSLPESILSDALVDEINAMSDMRVTAFLETIRESWIDFEFRGSKFSINNQFGEYWIFSDDPQCSTDILLLMRDRFAAILLPH